MADPAGVIGVISAGVSLSKKIFDYTTSFKEAPKCVADLAAETTALGATLDMLREHLQQETANSPAMKRTSALFFAADGCKIRLKEIEDGLNRDSVWLLYRRSVVFESLFSLLCHQ